MNEYPYYIVVRFESGILRKVFNDKKFKNAADAEKALFKLNEYHNKAGRTNLIDNNQFAILEYTAEYQGKISILYNFGEPMKINEPIV